MIAREKNKREMKHLESELSMVLHLPLVFVWINLIGFLYNF